MTPIIVAAIILQITHCETKILTCKYIFLSNTACFKGVGHERNLDLVVTCVLDLVLKSLQIWKDKVELDSSPKKSPKLCRSLMSEV